MLNKIFAGLLVALLAIGLIKYSRGDPVAETKPLNGSSAHDEDETSGRFRLTWRAREGETVRDESERNGGANARIVECSDKRFRIKTVTPIGKQSIFTWDKISNPEYGNWTNDNPGDYGKWYLIRTGKREWRGWCTDRTSGTADLWLTRTD